MFSNKRPQPGETEDDILAQEKAFLAAIKRGNSRGEGSSFTPAATVLKKVKRDDLPEVKNRQSGSADLKQPQEQMEVQGDNSGDEDPDLVSADLEDPIVSLKIQERDFDPTKLLPFPGQKSLPKVKVTKDQNPLPAASNKKLDAASASESKRGKSLFARKFDATFGVSTGLEKSHQEKVFTNEKSSKPIKAEESEPMIGDTLHPYLSGMTESEILEEQKKLVEKLDPNLVAFIKARRKANEASGAQNSSTLKKMEIGNENIKSGADFQSKDPAKTDSFDESELPIDPKTVHQYPGMKHLEADKLAWTGLIKEERKDAAVKPEDSSPDARFGFQGNLIPNVGTSDPLTLQTGLHHHGEEMDRAGYTIEELLTFVRSTKLNQRALALSTIGNIYENAHTGVYDHIFEKSLFQLADYMDFIYAIRTSLDHDDMVTVNAALKCLGQILYPWEEETCLDIVYLWEGAKPHPWMSTKLENIEATENNPFDPSSPEDEKNDTEVLELDLIDFLVNRSNLLTRITYFLEMKEESSILTEKGVEGIMQILVRVARHSPNELIAHQHLVELLIGNYASANWKCVNAAPLPATLKGVPLPMALKIVRILIDSSQTTANTIFTNFNIFPTVLSYLAYEDWGLEKNIIGVESLMLESFRIWIAFIAQGFAIDEYSTFFPILIKFLTAYIASAKLNIFDMLHSAHLFSLLLAILRVNEDSKGVDPKHRHSHWTLVKDVVSLVELFVRKIIAFLTMPHLQDGYDQDATVFSLSKALRFLIETAKYRGNTVSNTVSSSVLNLIKSDMYSRMTCDLKKYSIILAKTEEGNRYPSNFASVNAIRFGGKWNPVLEFRSCLSFITSIFAFLKLGNNQQNPVPLNLIMNPSVQAYVAEILKSTTQKDKADFFVRFELLFLTELIELIPPAAPERFSLVYKAVSQVPKCCPKLFNRLFTLALESSSSESDRETAFSIFGGYLMEVEDGDEVDDEETVETPDVELTKKKVTFGDGTKPAADSSHNSEKLEFALWSERCIGSHWILEPLQRMHMIVSSVPNYLKSHIEEIEIQCRVCLQLIEKCLESYCDFIVQTPHDFLTIYCRIGQVFLLGEPGIYIDGTISGMLKNIIRLLMNSKVIRTSKDELIFSELKSVPGIPHMFLDYYPDLLTEYSNNSYFNDLFAQFLLIPLRPNEDSKIKSNFWTMESLNSIRLTTEQAIVPLECLTSGKEKDPHLLAIYLRLLHCGRISEERNPFLFKVIKAQLNNSVSEMDHVLRGKLAQLKI